MMLKKYISFQTQIFETQIINSYFVLLDLKHFTKLSIAENIINLFFILVSQIDISQLLVFKTFPDPIDEFISKILINFDFL